MNRLSRSLCSVVGETIPGSHNSLENLFKSAGVPGDPPELAHHSKWKEWLYRAGQDPNVDSLAVLGAIIEEFMDLPPEQGTPEFIAWKSKRDKLDRVLDENGLRYYRFGRVLPQGTSPNEPPIYEKNSTGDLTSKPQKLEELVEIIVKGLRRAMHPLTHRRKGAQPLLFQNEYDVQDLLHSHLRTWISDIRPEEFTPSYAGSSTRMDFLLPAYELVIETKIVRDRQHAGKLGDELIIDIEHYRKHPSCKRLWCVVYDPDHLVTNSQGIKTDLEGKRSSKDGEVTVRVFVL